MRTDTQQQFDWSGNLEQLEERLVMSADPLSGALGGQLQQHASVDDFPSLDHHVIAEEPPALDHHLQSEADFWIDSSILEAIDNELGQIEQSLANAHDQSGLTQVRNDYGFDGTGQTVAVIDSGIAYDHFALGGGFGSSYRVVGGWDFTGENDADPYDDGPSGSHGTHVAGIVGADSGSNSGVAPGVDLVGLRVFDDAGNGYFSWVEDALQWVHDNRNNFDNPITAVNLSLGVATWNSDAIPTWANLEDEFSQLEQDGIFISVSAGNSYTSFNTTGLSYPAASPYVVPVASVDDSSLLSYYSQRNSRVIAAPGRGIVSTVPDYAGNSNGTTDDYASFSGTSMASPYVAGASVIIREAMEFVGYTNITQDMIYDHMIATADSFFDSATSANYNRLNLDSAIDALMPTDDFGSTLATSYNLGTIGSAMSMNGSISTLSDIDYFSFTAESTGTVTFEATNTTHNLTSSWLVNGPQPGDSVTLDVVGGQSYSVGFASADGLGFYDLDITAESTFPFTDWGSTSFSQFDNVNIAGETWYRVQAASDGYFTVGGQFDAGGSQINLELYSSALQLIDSGAAVNGTSRVETYASAGEELFVKVAGSNSDVDFQLTNLVSIDGTTVNVAGTAGDDAFAFTAGNTHQVSVKGVTYDFAAAAIANINFNGGNGYDSIVLTGTAGDETATLRKVYMTLAGVGFSASALGVESVRVDSGGGNDTAHLYDTAGDDHFYGHSDTASLYGDGFYNTVTGFANVNAFANAGGYDLANLYDSAGNDRFNGHGTYAYLQGDGFSNLAAGFDRVHAFGINGGYDEANLNDTIGDDRFYGYSTYAFLHSDQYYNYAAGFDRVHAFGINGGHDEANLYDSAEDDRFYAYSTYAFLHSDQYFNYASGFDRVHAFAINGGYDEANFYDSPGDDSFYGHPTYAYLQGSNFFNYASNFNRAHAFASAGGNDTANFYDSSGDDHFLSSGNFSYLYGNDFFNYASNFDRVNAFATAGGYDRADFITPQYGDVVYGRDNHLTYTNSSSIRFGIGFDYISSQEGTPGMVDFDVLSTDYVFEQLGNV